MLSAGDIHAFVRDERAWRRAAHRLFDDARVSDTVCSRSGNWLVFRRGTSENAFSLRFANSLRHCVLTDIVPTTAVLHTVSRMPRQRWNSSARCDTESRCTDPLQRLLAYNLQRKGVAAVLKKRRASPHARPRSISPDAREARRRHELARSAQEMMDLERYERRQLATLARKRFRAIASLFFGTVAENLIACELSGRRALFRQWQEGHCYLAASMGSELWRLTSMTPQGFKAVCRLIRSEAVKRRRIQVTEEEDRDLYARFMYVEQLKML
ncbi:hypothetical protein JIQ42_05624 [Leishmania sp. Namibia]|uniref:hypothetical protein n=1 Tax=Leishmania sp. Namibia TaxID=2802991 RepID=UPI001B790F5B|nr:hypothetical protein JIQ42_05624 [Leishmania sp. Namibia]